MCGVLLFHLCDIKKNSACGQLAISYQTSQQSNVHLALDPFTDILPNGFLGLFWSFVHYFNFLKIFRDHLHVPMKEVTYSNMDRIKTLISSIAIGCEHGKDINHKLVPYLGAAQCCQLDKFPDQSQINRFLRRLTLSNISELDYIFEHLLSHHGLFRSQPKVNIDFDCTGITVYGKTYQLARKGYFPKKRSSRGYHLSIASAASSIFKEILSFHFDPGNSHPDRRFWDAIYQVANVLGDLSRIGVIRTDAASGTGPNIEALIDHNLSFLIKGNDPRTAKNFAKKLTFENWQPLDFFTRIADMHDQPINNCKYRVRVILVETITPKGHKNYSHLYTDSEDAADGLYYRYNQRQTIESVIKEQKIGLNMTHLRTRQYLGIYSFLYFGVITFNLITLFKYHFLGDSDLAAMSAMNFTNKLMDIPAKMKCENEQLYLLFPENHELCKKYYQSLLSNKI